LEEVLAVAFDELVKSVEEERLLEGQTVVLLVLYFGDEGFDPVQIGFVDVGCMLESVLGAGRVRM
jgi:hypothetical protein